MAFHEDLITTKFTTGTIEYNPQVARIWPGKFLHFIVFTDNQLPAATEPSLDERELVIGQFLSQMFHSSLIGHEMTQEATWHTEG